MDFKKRQLSDSRPSFLICLANIMSADKQGRSQDFSLGGTGRAPKVRDEIEAPRGVGCGEGVSPENILNFYIKMVSSDAF